MAGMADMTDTADYWVGSLSMTVALAATRTDPQPLLRSALKEFLATRPPGNELGDMLRTILDETKGKPCFK